LWFLSLCEFATNTRGRNFRLSTSFKEFEKDDEIIVAKEYEDGWAEGIIGKAQRDWFFVANDLCFRDTHQTHAPNDDLCVCVCVCVWSPDDGDGERRTGLFPMNFTVRQRPASLAQTSAIQTTPMTSTANNTLNSGATNNASAANPNQLANQPTNNNVIINNKLASVQGGYVLFC
jgi:hypothetical protein